MSDATATAIESLTSADARYREAEAAVADLEGDAPARIPEELRRFVSILDSYEDRATGSGDFRGYLEFRGRIATFVENLPEALPTRDAFESAQSILEQRRLSTGDFDRARAALEPARAISAALAEREEAAAELRRARGATRDRLQCLEDRLQELHALERYAEIDLDRSVEAIHEPISTYNHGVRSAFQAFRQHQPAREVIELFALGDRYPLLELPHPPRTLLRAARSDTFASLSVPELLEYAEYSRSKLDHYVDDAGAFQDIIREHRRYLTRMDADPFVIEWPPPPAAELRWRLRELTSMADRFADDPVMQSLRVVADSVRKADQFDELREIALAREALDTSARQRITSGQLAEEIEDVHEQRDQLQTALEHAAEPRTD